LRSERIEYAGAIPILLAWLPKVRSLDLKQDVVRCLSVPFAALAAGALIDEFRRAEDEGLRWTIGNALAIVANEAVLADMIALARDRQYGRAREMVVLGLGNIHDPRVDLALIELLKDDQVSGHAIMAIGNLGAPAARTHVEPFLRDTKPWVRAEARKTLRKLGSAAPRERASLRK